MLNEEEGRTGGRYESGGAGCVCEKKKEVLHFLFWLIKATGGSENICWILRGPMMSRNLFHFLYRQKLP